MILNRTHKLLQIVPKGGGGGRGPRVAQSLSWVIVVRMSISLLVLQKLIQKNLKFALLF